MIHTAFTDADVNRSDAQFPRIYCDHRKELVYAPLWFHTRGLQQTASGYGARLNTGYMIRFNGRLYRVYCTIYSNVGTCWFQAKGVRIIVN